MQLACPHCATLNRVPTDRLGDGPVCGHCKQSLLPREPIELRSANFAALSQKSELPLLVDFWAAWCGPCRTMAPQFAQAAEMLSGEIVLGKLDTEAEPRLAGQFNMRSIPTLVLIQGGREIARLSGARPAADIVRWAREQRTT